MGIFDAPTKPMICLCIAFQTLLGSLVYIGLARPLLGKIMTDLRSYPTEAIATEVMDIVNTGYESQDHLPHDVAMLIARVLHFVALNFMPLMDVCWLQFIVMAQLFTWWYMTVFAPKLLQVYKYCFEIIRDAVVIVVHLPHDLVKDSLELFDHSEDAIYEKKSE